MQLELERARKDAEIERLRSVDLARANAALEAKDQENARMLAELSRHALEDALTGLPNRRSYAETLAQTFAHATRHGLALSVIVRVVLEVAPAPVGLHHLEQTVQVQIADAARLPHDAVGLERVGDQRP